MKSSTPVPTPSNEDVAKLLKTFEQPGTLLTIPDAGNVRAAFIDARTNSGIIVITNDGRWFKFMEGYPKQWTELPQPPER